MVNLTKIILGILAVNKDKRYLLFFWCFVLATAESQAQSFRLTIAAVSGNFEFGPISAPVEARAREGSIDITDKVVWSVQFTETKCGPTLLYRVGVLTSGNPAKIEIYYNSVKDAIPIGVYTYQIVAKRKSDGVIVTSNAYTFTIKPKVNEAPVLNISRSIDTTLAAGQNSISYLEIAGAATDACTDVITSMKWMQMEGPTLANYDAGDGKLVLQDAPVGTYVFQFSAQDDGGLTSQRTVNVYIRKKEIPQLELMKAFSPNDDGIDDVWKIENISTIGNLYSITIINQHGAPILQALPPFVDDVVWDGTSYGKPLAQGAYYFIIKDKDKQEIKRGSILLVR